MGASPLPIFFLGLAILDEIFDSFRKIWTGQTVYATTTAAAGQITGDRRSRGTLRSTHSNPRPSCTHKHTITLRVDSVHPWTRYSVPLLKEYYHKLNDIPKCRRVMHQVTTESNRKQPQATASNRKLPHTLPRTLRVGHAKSAILHFYTKTGNRTSSLCPRAQSTNLLNYVPPA